MKRVSILTFCLLTISSILFGHEKEDLSYLNNNSFSILSDVNELNNSDTTDNNLYLGIDAVSLTRNAEYFLPYTKGYTLLGFMLTPTLAYKINEKAQIEAGANLLGIAGDEKGVRKITPIFRIKYSPTNKIDIIGGSLYGNLHHKLFEPMYGFDRYFMENNEMGFQVLIKEKIIDADIWCNWETFIEPGDDKQEKLTFGIRSDINAINNDKNKLSFPIHILATHRGGQFTSLKDTCLETLFNICTGAEYVHKIKEKNSIKFSLPFFYTLNNSDENHIHTFYKNGKGLYPNISLSHSAKSNWTLEAGFWLGEKYFAPKGSYLFQSRSYFDSLYHREERKMATAKYFYEYNLKGLRLGADIQGYYDIKEAGFDFAFGIYLRFNDYFKLLSVKK